MIKSMRRPKGIIFDLGNTVLNEDQFDPLLGTAKLLEFAVNNHNLAPIQIQALADEINIGIRKVRMDQMIEFNVQNFHRLLYETLGIELKIGYPQAEREFYNASEKFSPTQGIYEVLNFLMRHKIKAGIISNWNFSSCLLEQELRRHKLLQFFSIVIASSDYGFTKPSPRIFNVAVKKMKFEPSEIWFAGDTLDRDIKGALDSGLYPVWYNPKGQPNTFGYDCLEIRRWQELIEKLKELT
jgi:HAD superfamily hydrolase (TIGR01549 family)